MAQKCYDQERDFYEAFDEPLQSGQQGVVDLAKANQRAILAIMEKRPSLYHWPHSFLTATGCFDFLESDAMALKSWLSMR